MSSPGAALQSSWARSRERGAFALMCLLYLALRLPLRPLTLPIVRLTTLYFFLFGRRGREASLAYLRRLERVAPELGVRADRRTAYRHFTAFADAILDKLDAWAGRIHYGNITFERHEEMLALARSGQGLVVLGSHLGNLEVCRALATLNARVRLNVLVHTRHADRFNRILRMAGATDLELVEVSELDAARALLLKERIARGEWVVIAADRVPLHGGRTVDVQFLGGTAPLPIGPYVLGGLLEAPVYLLFCLRRAGRIHVRFEPFAERIAWQRHEREQVIAAYAQRFAARLEHHLRSAPLQWFNFYPFWHETPAPASSGREEPHR